MMSWVSYLLLLYGLSWSFVGIFRWYALDKGLLDFPNERSSHFAPTPRGGGAIIFLGWTILLGALYYYKLILLEQLWIFIPVGLMGLLGLWEDHKGLSSSFRFLVQCLSAVVGLFLLQEGGEMLQSCLPIFVPLPLCFIGMVVMMVWAINLFNFMDGSDGIAAT